MLSAQCSENREQKAESRDQKSVGDGVLDVPPPTVICRGGYHPPVRDGAPVARRYRINTDMTM